MARPIKTGLSYFPFDVDFFNDEKIEAISGEFGIKGEIVAIKLLTAIYRNGYFIEWSEMLQMKMLKASPSITKDLLVEIVQRLVRWNFFDEGLFNSDKVLTSRGIQKRYFEALKRNKGREDLPYLLISVTKTGVSVTETQVNVTKTTQRKVKESKVNVLLEKEPKYNNNNTGAGDFENQQPLNNEEETLSKSCGKKFSQKFTPPTPEEVQEYCNERQNGIKGQEFCDYYQSKGWMIGKNKMKDWKAAVRTWERNNTNNNGKQSISTNTRATTGKSGKISAHQLLARAVNQQPTRDDESGNITIEVEAL